MKNYKRSIRENLCKYFKYNELLLLDIRKWTLTLTLSYPEPKNFPPQTYGAFDEY